MQLFDTGRQLELDDWLRGLFSAGISGGASAVTGGVVVSGLDPEHYNFQAGKFYVLVCLLFSVNAVVSMMKFLQSRPLPELKTVVRTVETTEAGKKPAVVVTTVQETSVEQKP